jgi:MoxR-like ATPase
MSDPAAELTAAASLLATARGEVARAIVGQERVIDGVLAALVCGGHVLLEGLPGLGKTELVKALSRACSLEFRRVQATPDLMPADILGTTVLARDQDGGWRTEFRKGPVFTQLLLADEINRATPKTQAALLEVMQEGTVTIGGQVHRLEQPFVVLATQNPIEQEGTYPLPEAQLDRFLFKFEVGAPTREELNRILDRTELAGGEAVKTVLDGAAILKLRALAAGVVVAPEVRDFAVRLVLATHPGATSPEPVRRYVRWGASPRAAQALLRAGRVRALAAGRAHLSCDDLRRLAPDVLRHRVILNYDGQADGIRSDKLVDEVLKAVPEAAA